MKHHPAHRLFEAALVALCVFTASAFAQPAAVEHAPAGAVFGESASTTQREPDLPREDETVDLYLRVSFQFTYDRVCIYYTTDGTEPSGSFGAPTGSTLVLRNDLSTVTFLRNENAGGVRDWWRAELPGDTRQYAEQVRYKVSAWQQFSGPEVFANGGAAYSFTNKLAWPGAGAGQPNPGAGYPPVSFWKEEAVFGNTFTAGQIDQNGAVYDMHFPTPGGIYGVGTHNEGYTDGPDTFPPLLPPGWRGQMHLNQATPGVRIGGVTHWLSNPGGVSYVNVQQSYLANSNTIHTSQDISIDQGEGGLHVDQYDFAPIGVAFPTTPGGDPIRHIYIKRMRITYNGLYPSKEVNVYWYMDPALNGGDTYDAMFFDAGRGVMCAYDKITRTVTGTGVGFTPPNEYNPTTDPDYLKNIALYLGAGMKTISTGGSGPIAADSWRDTSTDNGQGWIGQKLVIPQYGTREVVFYMVGGHFRPTPINDPMPVADGVYDNQIAPAIDWLNGQDPIALMNATDSWWNSWVTDGTTIDTPDDDYDRLLSRGLLATALHLDGFNGGVIAGFHNGAYPFVWPRDAVYAANTLARTGHLPEARKVIDWMRDTCYRAPEWWGRPGFWKQKYTTDGYVVWGAPQIDETAAFPWGVEYIYDMTADTAFLSQNYNAVRDSVYSMTRDSNDSRLRFEEAFNLVYSNNVWEDSYDTFVYSNASVWQGLESARSIAATLGNAADAAEAQGFRDQIKSGLDGRLDWNGENTDISQFGVSYPFPVYAANDPRVNLVADRINGVANDRFGNNHPLVNFTGEHQGTINRYWGDGYWNGGPWFLSTLWYGLHYITRADLTPGNADINNHKFRVDVCIDRLGPAGLGAEQMSYSNSYQYPGGNFVLQTAWPNAWESMSTAADSVMAFLDYTPDAPNNTMNFEPKLPSDWPWMAFRNVTLIHTPTARTHKVDVYVDPARQDFTNRSGHALHVTTVMRLSDTSCLMAMQRNGVDIPFTLDPATGRVSVAFDLEPGVNAVTSITPRIGADADVNCDGSVNGFDIEATEQAVNGDYSNFCQPSADLNNDGAENGFDIETEEQRVNGAPC
ncbi:hypothetical protein PHYC_02638 [Phycisphaerales bacterium]|nr:hypothetical protein PHYC_02638 [Phycisphaerales bacterium]